MRSFGLIIGAPVGFASGSGPSALDNDLIALVNSRNGVGWVAARNARFDSKTLAEASSLLGVIDVLAADVVDDTSTSEIGAYAIMAARVPTSFDSREEWPSCFVNSIRDQGSCGSCWAFGAAEVLSDRYCIATGTPVELSPQDLIGCGYDNKYMLGCEGGVPEYAWKFMSSTGISTEACIPYAEADLDFACPTTCADGTEDSKYKATALRHLSGSSTTGAVQQEMLAHGPIQSSFKVYQDFFSYSSGVYSHVTGDLQGKHAIKFVGWGVLEDRSGPAYGNYWVVANSWGPDWGEEGYFKINRNVNECGIEESMDFGQVLLSAPTSAIVDPSTLVPVTV